MRKLLCVMVILGMILPVSAVEVPILMYHHFTDEVTDCPDQCSAERFREHLVVLAAEGYTSVTFADLLAFTDGGTFLPEKPVLLTADDGYRSVIETALPVLRTFGMTMSVAVVGSRMGQNCGISHFSLEEARQTGLELVSHTWDLHGADGRGILTEQGTLNPLFLPDVWRMRQIPAVRRDVFVYPYGKWNGDSEALLKALGYRITVTTRDGVAEIRAGEPETLFLLPRIGMHDGITAGALSQKLKTGS